MMRQNNSTWSAVTVAAVLLLGWGSTCITAFTPCARSPVRVPAFSLPVATSTPTTLFTDSSDDHSQQQPHQQPQHATSLIAANMALDVLANKCGNPRQEQVIAIADQCQSQWEAMRGSNTMEPDTVSFNTVLKAWSKCCQSLADYKKQDFAHSGTGSGISQDHPQVYTAKDAAERATLLLLSQEKDYQSGVLKESARPDTLSYNEAIGAWARSGVAEAPLNAERLLKRMLAHEYIQPDSISYNGVIDAWAYSGKPEAVQKVKQIWQHMESLYAEGQVGEEESKTAIIKPTIRTINSIIQAHVKSIQEMAEARDVDGARKTAKEAEQFLDLMKERYQRTGDPDHMPDVMTYTTLIDCHGRCAKYQSTLKAKALLEELNGLYQETNNPRLKPNVRAYTSLITAWSKTRSPESTREAEKLLKELSDSTDPDLQPNARTFTAVIQTWGRSSDHTKAQRALKLLQSLKSLEKEATVAARKQELKPTLVTYNAALDACARCQGNLQQQTDALKIAFAILKAIQLDKSIEANCVTYSTLLRACSFLLQPGAERNQVASVIFQRAQKAGVADFRVLLQLKKTVDTASLVELLKGLTQDRPGSFDFTTAPPDWSRNVR